MDRGMVRWLWLPTLALAAGLVLVLVHGLRRRAAAPPAAATVEIRGATLTPRDLHGAALLNCSLIGDWRAWTLAGCRFQGCDLTRSLLGGPEADQLAAVGAVPVAAPTDLRGCRYDRATRWPEGFDPQAAGASMVE
jgi:hypothetical protein